MDYIKLPIGSEMPTIINAVVEVPLGQTNKYEYDKDLQVFRLDRPLYTSVYYPCEYGFIPSTLSEDGDTLDILILADRPSFPGCFLEVRPIGMLEVVDQGVPDRKILSAAAHNPSYREFKNHTDVFPHLLAEIEHFFVVYKQLENKHTEVTGWRDAAQARKTILQCHERFKKS
ncbi:MAG TPA: inorganic diphosphatase [Verrucomicrobiae bacterium]|nr:inorganic diphosphatase [Verrucomicrobiae bacterium]